MADLLFSWVANILISIPDTKFIEFYPEQKVPYTLKILRFCTPHLKHQNHMNYIAKQVMIISVAAVYKE